MTDLRKRGPDGTLQRRVFIALQSASMSPRVLSDALGVDEDAARKACYYLAQRGLVTKHAIAHRLVIYAAVAGKHPPSDRRGKPAGCRNHRGAVAWAKWLLMMHAKHGPTWRPKTNAHALDAWRSQ